MIKLNYNSEKEALNVNKKESLFLVELEGEKNQVKRTTKKQKLNLSLAIDISGSMSEYILSLDTESLVSQIGVNNINNRILGLPTMSSFSSFNRVSKLDLVKKAAIKAIDKMKDGDFVSVVAFDDKTTVVFDSKELTKENRSEVVRLINALGIRGGTDVHAGWLAAATEVAKTMKEKYLNRVLILTDGETMSGIRDPLEICKNVAALRSKGISTSTFGVGSRFNEDLLQGMSDKGAGNFYYIKDEKDFDDVFNQEFNGLLNVAGSEIVLSFETENGVVIEKQLNNLEKGTDGWILSDLAGGRKIPLLFKINIDYPKDLDMKGNFKLGNIILKYKNENGEKVELKTEVEMPLMKNKKWESLPYIQEVKVQEMLLIIAEERLNAGNLAMTGNIGAAKEILRSASAMASSLDYADERLTASLNSLQSNLASADNLSMGDFKKSMVYESYRTRTGKDS
jgi:Ca-activated chloride channel family protein